MAWGEFLLYQSPRRLYLKAVDVREGFWGVRASPAALRMAVKWCCELSGRLMPGIESDNLLSLLWGSVKNLSVGLSPLLLDVRFAWRWGNLWGVAPSLDYCASCGASLDVTSGCFAAGEDGLMCAGCVSLAAEARFKSISASALRALRDAATLPREKFSAWAAASASSGSALADCSSWLYSFLSRL
jgi:DNA repair protein RecO (recombination protein O)